MGDTSKVLCSWFAQGACRFGDSCRYSHSSDAPASNVCKFYLKGSCSYGDRCRYEHSRPKPAGGVRSARAPPPAVPKPPVGDFSKLSMGGGGGGGLNANAGVFVPGSGGGAAPWATRPLDIELPDELDLTAEELNTILVDDEDFLNDYEEFMGGEEAPPEFWDPSAHMRDRPLCHHWLRGSCARGDSCTLVHGNACPNCNRNVLHPYRDEESEEHIKACKAAAAGKEAESAGDKVECSICLEVVMEKPRLADRRFGVLDGCDHPFCLGCIREWRAGTDGKLSIDGAVRTCPVCRNSSHFVIPSAKWVGSEAGRAELIQQFKAKCKGINCKHFSYGEGQCPFGNSCFYKHAYRDGSLEEVNLRHRLGGDGEVSIQKPNRLADFLEGHL